MFLTTHAVAGITISQFTGMPLATFGWSFLSHYLLDFIPHGDEELYRDHEWKVQHRFRRVLIINAIDVAALIVLVFGALRLTPPETHSLLLLGVLGGIVPDFFEFLFPIIHQRFSWLFLVRWLYAVTKPTGLRYVVRAQNRFHQLLHHDIIRRDVSFAVGLTGQLVLIAALFALTIGLR